MFGSPVFPPKPWPILPGVVIWPWKPCPPGVAFLMGVVMPDISGSWNKNIENILWTFCQSFSSSISTQWVPVDETGQESTQKIKDKNNGVQCCHYQPGQGFCLASVRIIPGCFYRKQKESKAKKAFLMFNSLLTKWVIPGNLKSQWQPCVLQLMLGFPLSVTSQWHECYWVQYTVRFKKLTKNCIVKRSDGLH